MRLSSDAGELRVQMRLSVPAPQQVRPNVLLQARVRASVRVQQLAMELRPTERLASGWRQPTRRPPRGARV